MKHCMFWCEKNQRRYKSLDLRNDFGGAMTEKKIWATFAILLSIFYSSLSAQEFVKNDDVVDEYVVDSFEKREIIDEDDFLELCQITSFCLEPMTYVDVDTGYRWDRVCNRVVLSGVGAGVFTSAQTVSNLSSYQVGIKGQWSDYNWIVRGCYHTGWVQRGDYTEANFEGTVDGVTNDGSAALGCLFYTSSCWGSAFFAGWSYDRLDLESKNVIVGLDGRLIPIGNIKCKNWFQGPWIGMDLIFQPSLCANVTLSYELHHAHWHGTRLLENDELGTLYGITTGFSNRREHHNLWGQNFQLEGSYTIFKGYNIGLVLKYLNWQSAGNGKYKRTIVPVDPGITHQFVSDVEWHSFSAMFRAGLLF